MYRYIIYISQAPARSPILILISLAIGERQDGRWQMARETHYTNTLTKACPPNFARVTLQIHKEKEGIIVVVNRGSGFLEGGGVKIHRWWLCESSGGVAIIPQQFNCLTGGELGDGLGAFRDGVLGKLSGEDEADGSLNLTGREGGFLVVAGELAGFKGHLFEDVVDERVHDGHATLGDAGVGVHLLQHLVDVGGVALGALLLAASGLAGFLGSFRGFLGWSLGHDRWFGL